VIDRTPAGRAAINGTLVDPATLSIAWTDPAVQWGLGVFETVAIREGSLESWDAHLRRLEAAATRLDVRLPSKTEIERTAAAVAGSVPGGHGWLKVIVSRSSGWVVFAGTSEAAEVGQSASAVILPWRRHHSDPLAGVKSLAYAASMLGLEEARRRGADEGLFLNERGHVVEGCTSNVFIIRGRAAVTPAIGDGARDGVTRERAIEALRAMGLSVRQSKVRVLALRAADEVFLTSSLLGVRPVVRIDGRNVAKGKPGRTTQRLAERLTAREVKHHA